MDNRGAADHRVLWWDGVDVGRRQLHRHAAGVHCVWARVHFRLYHHIALGGDRQDAGDVPFQRCSRAEVRAHRWATPAFAPALPRRAWLDKHAHVLRGRSHDSSGRRLGLPNAGAGCRLRNYGHPAHPRGGAPRGPNERRHAHLRSRHRLRAIKPELPLWPHAGACDVAEQLPDVVPRARNERRICGFRGDQRPTHNLRGQSIPVLCPCEGSQSGPPVRARDWRCGAPNPRREFYAAAATAPRRCLRGRVPCRHVPVVAHDVGVELNCHVRDAAGAAG